MGEDRFANWAGIAVTESAAGVLTFNELLTGVGFNTKKGMLIDQIDYFIPSASTDLLLANADNILFGLTSSVGVTDLADVTDGRTIHSGHFNMRFVGAAASFAWTRMPLQHQFFPSLIHANQRVFAAVQGISLAAVATVRLRLYWRFIDLTDREITELVQATLLQA